MRACVRACEMMNSICTLLHHVKNDCWIDSFSTKVVLPVVFVVAAFFVLRPRCASLFTCCFRVADVVCVGVYVCWECILSACVSVVVPDRLMPL